MKTAGRGAVLISGASIAGPALAHWLSAAGFAVTVVERAPALRRSGQAVDLRGAGRAVVERMGLMDAVRAVTLDQRGLAYVNSTGRITVRLPVDSFGGEGLVSEIEILRGDLCQVFYDATSRHAEYLFDDAVTQVEQDDDGVDVAFEKEPSRRFAFVIGADGLHSAVRGLALAAESIAVRPLHCYTAWFTAPAADDLDGWYLMHNAPGGRVASLRPGRLPDESKANLTFRSEPLQYDRRNDRQHREIVANRFAGVGWKVPWLVEAMREAPDFAFDSLGQVRLPQWSHGRVALVGDAAYCPSPLTGLGTSVALVGGYVLAGELATQADHRVALTRYERIVRPYVTQAQRLPPGGVRSFAPRSAIGIALQNTTMRWMSRWPLRPLLGKQFAKAGDIALPAYPQLDSAGA